MPRDHTHAQTLRPVLPGQEPPAPELPPGSRRGPSGGGGVRGLWRAVSTKQKLMAGAALLACAGAAVVLVRRPPSAWADVVAEPGLAPASAPAAPRPPTPAGAGPRQPASPPPPAAAPPRAQRIEASVTIAAPPRPAPAAEAPSPVPMAASPDAPPAAAPPPAPGGAAEPGAVPVPPPPAPARAAAAPTPAAAPEAETDPTFAEVKRLAAQAETRTRPAAAPGLSDAALTRITAMVTDLSAITKRVLERQAQAEDAQAAVVQRLGAIEQRLTFAEARAAVSATVAVSQGAASAAVPVQAAPPQPFPPSRAQAGPRAPVVGPHSYRVLAASPGLAYLAVQNPMPGQQANLEVRINCQGAQPPACHEEVPGLGKVLGIGQRGTVWEVRTAGGTIER